MLVRSASAVDNFSDGPQRAKGMGNGCVNVLERGCVESSVFQDATSVVPSCTNDSRDAPARMSFFAETLAGHANAERQEDSGTEGRQSANVCISRGFISFVKSSDVSGQGWAETTKPGCILRNLRKKPPALLEVHGSTTDMHQGLILAKTDNGT